MAALDLVAVELERASSCQGAAFTPDGRSLVVGELVPGTTLRTLSAWDTASWQRRWTVPSPDAPVDVTVARDGSWIATAYNSRVSLWDPADGASLGVLEGDAPVCAPIAALAGERVLAVFRPRGRPASLSIWDTRSGAPLAFPVSFENDAYASSLTVDPFADRVATFARGALALWDLASNRKLHDFGGAAGTVPYPAGTMPLVFHPAGDRVIAGGVYPEGGPAVFDAATGHKLASLKTPKSPGGASALAVSPCGRWLVGAFGWEEGDHMGWQDLGLRIWDLEKGTIHKRIPMEGRPLEHLVFSADGGLLVGSNMGALRVWRARTDG